MRRALHYLRTTATDATDSAPHDVSDDLVERVRAALREMPDVRDDRVREAKDRLRADGPSAGEVAAKIIGRAISDSLR
ncbi:MAG TPA: flagellar biosynthesis anti-sigma factor FlgM [Coriobacteriia bacterium]|nr:flagellar biosynthesis anti-sigma factor FlgM [Coriobacteriia bacterium]